LGIIAHRRPPRHRQSTVVGDHPGTPGAVNFFCPRFYGFTCAQWAGPPLPLVGSWRTPDECALSPSLQPSDLPSEPAAARTSGRRRGNVPVGASPPDSGGAVCCMLGFAKRKGWVQHKWVRTSEGSPPEDHRAARQPPTRELCAATRGSSGPMAMARPLGDR